MPLISEINDELNLILNSNSPWLKDNNKLRNAQPFRREAFYRVIEEINSAHEMAVLIKGPRRVGKTEIQKQLIIELIKNRNVPANRVLYLTLDDALIQSEPSEERSKRVLHLLNSWAQQLGFKTYDDIEGVAYCFLDEVQAVKDWDLLIKNRVERNPNVRVVLSGSAAHAIFQKSLKTLMGRVIPIEISTFSFREYLAKEGYLTPGEIADLQTVQRSFEADLSTEKLANDLKKICDDRGFEGPGKFRIHITNFLRDGGFPQIWKLNGDSLAKANFIDENYVKKVTLEDLQLLQQIKKPDIYERLLRHLFARPAQEYNQNKTAGNLGIGEITLREAIKLLQETNLLIFMERFSAKAEPLQRKFLKIYPIDYGLTTAMTKIVPDLKIDTEKGTIAETLVAQNIKRLHSKPCVAYIRTTKGQEVDFYLRSDLHDCPIEVKYRNEIKERDIKFMAEIIREKKLNGGLIINIDDWEKKDDINFVPLWAFMLIS